MAEACQIMNDSFEDLDLELPLELPCLKLVGDKATEEELEKLDVEDVLAEALLDNAELERKLAVKDTVIKRLKSQVAQFTVGPTIHWWNTPFPNPTLRRSFGFG